MAMTSLISSPMGLSSRFDIFDQPSSPTLKHEDLPAEFGERSFGSSMSLGSSFDLTQASATAAAAAVAATAAASVAVTSSMPSLPSSGSGSRLTSTAQVSESGSRPRSGSSLSRQQQYSLGAAMGTVLNAKSPGLGAKLSSPHHMDISPAPPSRQMTKSSTPPKTYTSILPPGSAMKEDTPPSSAVVAAAAAAANARRSASSSSSAQVSSPTTATRDNVRKASDPALSGGSLGRLFGTELSLNEKQKVSSQTQFLDTLAGLEISPDKEPPAKRRPNSLPTSQPGANSARPSLRSLGMGPAASGSVSASKRPNLHKAMTTSQPSDLPKAGKRTSLEALRQHHRASDPNVPTTKSIAVNRPPFKSKTTSLERLRNDVKSLAGFDLGQDREQSSGSTATGGNTGSSSVQRSSVVPAHATIIESPSPSALANEGLGSYFFAPQSPEHIAAQLKSRRPSLASSSRQSISSVFPNASSSSVLLQEKPRPRSFERAASSAVVPSMLSRNASSTTNTDSGPHSSSSLGKRSNPYSKRPNMAAIAQTDSYLASSLAVRPAARTTAPAPRRCQSAIDNSKAFIQAGEDISMMSGSSFDATEVMLADTTSPDTGHLMGRNFPDGFDASGSPIAPSARGRMSRPGMLRRPSKDDSSPLGYGMGKRKDSSGDLNNVSQSPMVIGSPYGAGEGLPGFGASEREGKVLPCHNVKGDGLMRITPQTLAAVLDDKYSHQMENYHIIDCRFGYEYEGGHIPGAINLSTMERVKNHFLKAGQGLHAGGKQLPPRTQSGRADKKGNTKKQVLIFHCEFSCKRAPSMALALRQADRALAQDYPSCHFPEVYVLEGGYKNFFDHYSSRCEPPQYVEMDDPKFQDKRSTELNGFRKQFARHRSFTYGDTSKNLTASSIANPDFGRKGSRAAAIKEEDSSFEGGSSPSAAQADAIAARKRTGQQLHAGSSNNDGPRAILPTLKPLGFTANGDISWASSAGDSSFEGGPTDSPCAVVGSRKPSLLTAGPVRPASGSLGRHSLQRASTAGNVLHR